MRSIALFSIVVLLLSSFNASLAQEEESAAAFSISECLFVRQIDGRCNNPFNLELGAAGRYLARGAEGVWYADGQREPVLTPNPRTVSNNLFRGDDSVVSPHGHNLLWTFFGQFVTHDLMGVHRMGDVNISQIPDSNNPDVWIRIPLEQSNDSFYSLVPPIPTPYMRVLKSRGDVVNGRFEIGSDSTAFLDLDVVYGKEYNVTNKLRAFVGGELKSRVYNNYTAAAGSSVPATQKSGNFGEWLPLIQDVDPNRECVPVSPQLVAATTANIPLRFLGSGDGRNGENYALQLLQGLFMREHNRLARKIAADKPHWSDEQVFQLARKINIAQYQAIVMYEYLPSLLLDDYSRVGRYDGYEIFVDPTPTQLFAFAFRFGHTTVPDTYFLKNQCNVRPFNSSRDGPRSGQQSAAFMPADQIAQVGVPENILHALLFENSRAIDPQFPESLRTIRGANADIIVQNQVRAAENGIPDYHTIRKLWYGGPHANLYNRADCGRGANHASETSPAPDPLECFLLINSNVTVATALQSLYGKVNKINFYTAVVSEEPENSAVGRTSARIIADQFRRVRDGDRWWFESAHSGFTAREKRDLKRTKLANLLRTNFPSANVQDEAFYSPDEEHFVNCA